MNKILGIFGLLVVICVVTTIFGPKFVDAFNIQNTIRLTSLFGILAIGVAFTIITGGIDLSVGSLVGLMGCVLVLLLTEYNWHPLLGVAAVIALSAGLGLAHGLLIAKMRLQPFIVTLCGLLTYRGIARWITSDHTYGFGSEFPGLRYLAVGKPLSVPVPFLKWISAGHWGRYAYNSRTGEYVYDEAGNPILLDMIEWIAIPMPALILLGVAIVAGVFLNYTIWGRYMLALGRNEEAARYSGINTDRMTILAYVICSALGGLGAVLFALDNNSVQPSSHGNSYELYAIAAAVLGGCSLRGGEGSILGVVIGMAVVRLIYNASSMMGIPPTLEFAIIGMVILAGVIADELVKRAAARRRASRQAQSASTLSSEAPQPGG